MLLKNIGSLWPPFGRRAEATPGSANFDLTTLTNLWPPFPAMDIGTVTLAIADGGHTQTADEPVVTTNLRYWVNASADGLWHNPANWAATSGGAGGAGIPIDGDDVHFDSGSVSSCTVGSAISIKSLTVHPSYSGILNFNSQTVYCAEDFLLTGGTVRLGYTNMIHVGGNVNTVAGSLFPETSTLNLTGVSKTLTATSAKGPYAVTVALGAAYSMADGSIQGNLTVNGSLDIGNFVTAWRTVTVGATGALTGSGELGITSANGLTSNNAGGTWSVATTSLFPTVTNMPSIGAGTYNSATVNIYNTASSIVSTRMRGNITFGGDVNFYRTGSSSLAVDNTSYNPVITVMGDVFVDRGVIWSRGSGSLTFAGTANQTVDIYSATFEPIRINKTGGRVTLLTDLDTAQFTGDDGDFDLDGHRISVAGPVDINGGTDKFRFHNGTDYSMDSSGGEHGTFVAAGNITLDGDATTPLYINELDFSFNLPYTAVARYCVVQNSEATGTGTPVDAEDGTNTDVTGNIGWDFNRDLVVSDSSHTHSADSPAINAFANLGIDGSDHAHSADLADVNSHVVLPLLPSDHGHTADAPELTTLFTLAIAPADHTHTADSLWLASTGELGILPCEHGLTSDQLDLITFENSLTTDASAHGHSADEPVLQVVFQLVIADSAHEHSAEITSSLLNLQGLNSQHSTTAGAPEPSVTYLLVVDRVNHAHRADGVALDTFTTPVIFDPDQSRDECDIICGPRCEWIFSRLRAWPLIRGGTRVEWTLHPRFADPQPHTFQLQFGRTGNPLADDWTNVGLPVVNMFYAFDDTQRVYNNFQWTHYRVLLTTAQGTYASKPQNLYGSLPKRQWRIAREIERMEQLRLRKEAGQEGYLLKRKLFGEPCTCLDPQTREVNNPQCELCYGTGVAAGYYAPYPCFYAELGLSGTNNRLDGGQSRGTIDDAGRTWARMINSPQIFSHDVWVDRDTDFRWEIHGVSNIAEVNGMPVVVKAELRRLPFSHPVYDIEIDGQVPV